ncbi:MAG TPA: serine--tRNA ligase [Mycobacteriales bacterium]|nr:serine--tRNA ligase [Mycobacteriales bacterium]
MIDLRALREAAQDFRDSQQARGEDPAAVDRVLAADERRRAAVTRADGLRAEANAASKAIQSATPDERPTMIERAKTLKDEVKAAEVEQSESDAELRTAAMAVGNLVDPRAPVGGEADSVVIETIGEVPSYDFEPRDHVEIGTALGAIDIERGAKVSGARFYFLTGVGAQLELALVNLAMAQADAAGFTAVIAPALVRPEAMEGTGYLGAHASEVYRLADDDLYLVGTSEVALAAMHSDEVFETGALPRRYAGFSSCFRREAGSYGQDTKGIIRVHWFDKVEMFCFVEPAQADAEHQRLLDWEKEFLAKLELPFQVLDIATADLGSSATRKFDCEAWFPSQGRYRELTSTSNCMTFQSRRLAVRYRTDDGPAPVATLNATLCAIARTIACLLEVHQQVDGSVRVPEALRPYLGGRGVLTPA